MISKSRVANGVLAYAEGEIIPSLCGWQLWAAGAALALAEPKIETLISLFAESKICTALGVVGANGEIDVSRIIKACKDTVHKNGNFQIDIQHFGEFTLGEADFDKLQEYILKAT